MSGDAGIDNVIGDGIHLYDDSVGGNDHVYGGDGGDWLYGDATGLFNNSRGGDDQLSGGDGHDIIFGDAATGDPTSKGGNDELFGDAGNDELYGDFGWGPSIMSGVGGDDRLDGGTGDDALWGGGGNDTFKFERYSGLDAIFDFKNTGGEQDKIDLSSYGLSFSNLKIYNDGITHPLSPIGGLVPAAVIELSPDDKIFVAWVDANDLSAADFIF